MALDPRTKLYLVALANLLLFFHVDVVVESLTVLLLLLPLLGAGRWAAAVRFGCIYVLLLVGTWASTLDDGGSWLHMLGLLCVGIRMMMPCLSRHIRIHHDYGQSIRVCPAAHAHSGDDCDSMCGVHPVLPDNP